jgi:predicted acylesterase/phospholipase RssA
VTLRLLKSNASVISVNFKFFKVLFNSIHCKVKKLRIFSGSLFIIIVIFLIITAKDKNHYSEGKFTAREGTAIIMTGAAARIPQEAGLLEELYNRDLLKDVVFISGVSSGALNAVMLNGILSGKMTWSEYKEILYNLKNDDIFIQNEDKKLPVNTSPARALYTKIVEGKLGYHKIGDLPYMTAISFTDLKDLDLKKKVYRMCSRKINEETDTTLSLVDIMMASSAFPLVFPPARIRNVKTIPDVEYVDGGIGDDHVPYHALLEFEKFRGKGVANIYIVSRKSDGIPEISEELKGLGIDDKGRFDKLGVSMDNILRKGMIKRLEAFAEEAPEMILLSRIWMPEFDRNFLMFNFDDLKEQYILTSQWARTHDPVPLGDFLMYNIDTKKEK